ncbi:Ig-like domain-containing protein [Pseudoalteromonas sp. SR41-5]|uniref:Ig-like domain-containing protein n=3 Tax=Pseudoalteromonas TaxID=53246 RepID=UPI0015FD8AF6|nr:Ig-like domain-containing protein [Pseudoalteromonas sp. SR41-5]MBB1290942.1 Ig-like domain repeat protein [Pseudoalteromonas sp. SR41-5]
MEANQLVVIDIQGSAGVVLDDGSIRALNVGDTITVGDLVVTAIKSSLQIDVQGETLSIPANQKVKITPDLLAKEARDSSETTVFDESLDEAIASLDLGAEQDPSTAANSDVTDFLDALEGDGDILDNLEATAAGGGNAAGADGGSSFVQLTRISESVDPSSVTFDSSFDQGATEAFNLRDTSDGIVPDSTTASISLNELGITNSSQPTITGTSENLIGETVNVTVTDVDGNSQVVSVVIGPDGTFEITLPTPIADGPVTVVVEATDPVGNPINDTISIEVDTTPPLIAIDPVADSASQTVTVTGTVSGLNTGDNVSVTLTDSAGTVQTIVTQVDAQGNWVITTTSPLSEGEFNVSAVAIDAAGNQAIDQALANVDLTAPVITVNVTDETNNSTPPLVGTTNGVPEGTQVTITVTDSAGQIQTLTAVTQADGSWSVEVGTPLPEGDFTVDAQVSDSVGNLALASDSGVIDLTAPSVQINNINDTQDTTPTITGNAQDVPAGSIISVVITDFDGQTQTLLTQTNADGDWSIDVTTPLAEGQFEVDASVSDAAGNQAQANNQGVVDLTNPDITVTAIADTNDTTPTFVGRVEDAPAGSVITVLVTDINGNVQTLTTLLNEDGTWSVDANEILPGGEFTATASVSDAAGNEASAQTNGEITFAPISIQIDAIANTNDTTPFLSGNTGNVPAGTTITLTITASDGSTFTLLAVTQEDGSWSAQVTNPLPEGDFTVVAAVIDDSGNEAQASAVGNVDLTVSINFIIDTNDTTPTISGSTQDVEPGAVVTVTFTGSDGVAETVQVVTGADGSWSVEASNELVEGQFSVVATVTDAAGNTASASETGEIDLTDPAITINPIEDTNDVTPSVSGNVIDVPAGTEVTLVITDSEGNEQTLTTITNADGTYTADIIADLSEGDFTVTASVSDTAGNSSTATVTGTVDLTAPSVTINNIADTNDTTPTLTGSTQGLASGSEVTLIVTDSLGAEQQLVTTISADGTWSIEIPTALSEGDFTVTANVSDNAGNAAQDSQLGSVDTTPPLVAINDFADSNDTTPTFSGTTSDVAPGSLVSVLVTDANGESQTLTAVVSEDGTWQVGATQAVAEGDFTITATVTDAAGNEASDTVSGTIDLSAPIIAINTIPDSADTTPTISGSVQNVPAGTTVTLIVTDAGGNTQTITTQTLADGSWTADTTNELVEGDFSVNAIVSDEAGNQSEASAQGTIDNTAPNITIDALADSNDTTPTISGTATGEPEGTVVTIIVTDEAGNPQTITTEVQADGTFSVDVPNELSEGEFTVEVSVTDTAGNETTATTTGEVDTTAPTVIIDPVGDTNDTTPTISGTATGEPEGTVVTIKVTDDAGNPQIITTEVQADGTFSVDVPNELSEGEFTVEVSVTDTAGNETTATTTGEVDTAAPTVIIDPVGDTNDTTPTISGTATGEPEGTVVTITVTDEAGNPQTITTEVQADGTFSVDVPNELSEGEFTVEVSVTDNAGNETTATTTGEVDTTAPIVTINALGDTSDTTPTISGTVSGEPAGSTITLTVTDANGAVQTISAQVIADGSWTVEVPAALAEGTYSVDASISDSAGNEGTASASGTIDTSALTITIDVIGETNDQTPQINGDTFNAQVGSQVEVQITDSAGGIITLTTVVDENGLWSVTPPADLAEGTILISATVTDIGGGSANAELDAVIDITPPTIQVNELETSNDTTPVISGNTTDVVAGTVINLTVTDSQGVVRTFSTTTDADGNWSVELSQELASGDYSVEAEVSDAAGNSASDTATGIIDTSGPSLTVNFDTVTNDSTPTISGTSDADVGTSITVVITDENGVEQTLSTTVDANGNWEVTPQTDLNEGDNTIEVSVSDEAGNTTTVTDTITLDTQAPILTIQNVGDVSDLTPELQGTSNEIGGTVTLTITDSAGAVQTIETLVGSDGHWNIEIPGALAQGDFTVSASITDAAGNESTANSSGNVDTITPIVTVDALGLGNDSTPVVSGTSTEPEGTVVNIVITDSNGDEHPFTATVDANGDWQATSPELPDGSYTVQASITDDAGNTGGATQTGNLDTLAPTLTLDTVGATNNSTPTISGTSNAPAGTVITINVTDADNTETFTATVQADGSWSADVPNALTDGPLTIEASVSDNAGNTTTLSETATLNTTAPSISINALVDTNDTTPTINGTSDAADNTTISLTFEDSAGNITTVDTTVTGGVWSVDAPTDLAEGEYTVTAQVDDGLGNIGSATETGQIDLTGPSLVITDNGVGNDTTPTIAGTSDAPQGSEVTIVVTDSSGAAQTMSATVLANGTWSIPVPVALAEGAYTISASVEDVAGNDTIATGAGEIDTTAPTLVLTSPGSSNDITPTLSGTSDAVEGTVINFTVVDDQGNTQTFTTTVDADGNFSVEVPTALAEGPYTITANISDVAGNSTDITGNGTIDTTAPSVSVDAPILTNDSTPIVTGTSDAPNSTITVTFTDAANATQSIDVQTDANGNWSATPTTDLAEGNYSVSASITDAAGNTGTGTDSGEVDVTAPELEIIPSFLLGNLVSLSGDSDLPGGSVITITEYLVGGLVGATYTATTNPDGTWGLANITVPLLNLAYVTASATDAAGNVRTVNTLDFDNVAPELTVSVDALSNDSTPVISGTTDMGQGTVINITVTDSEGESQAFTATVQAGGDWSVAVPAELAQGQYTVVAEVRDSVGNLTTQQAQGEIDSVAPTLIVNEVNATIDTTPTISGTSNEIGADVTILIGGQTLTATVGTDGNWQVDVPVALVDGDYTAQVNVTDDANNTSSTTIDLTIDTQVPVIVLNDITVFNTETPVINGTSTEPQDTVVDIVITDSNGDIHTLTAIVDANGDWQVTAPSLPDGNYDVEVSITDDAGNQGVDTGSSFIDTQAPSITINALGTINDSTPTISGTSNEPENTSITVTVTDGDSTETYTTVVGAGGAWTLDITDALTDGEVAVSASVTDAAGNESVANSTAMLNTNAPTININTIIDTNDQTPAISGTSSAIDNSVITVVITDVNNVSHTVTTTVVGGIWSVDATSILPEGEFTVSASVTEGGLTSNTTGSGVIDLTPPALNITPLTISNDTTPTISGTTTAPQGAIVAILITDSLGAEQTVNATVGANGTWSVAASTELSEGAYTVSASTTDTAGNPVNTSITGVVDITAPVVTISDIVGSTDLTPSISGSVTGANVGDAVAVVFTDAQGNEHTVNTTVQTGGVWSVEATSSLSQGDYSVEVFVTDSAGNTGDATNTATIDTIAPEISINQSSLILTQDSTPLITGTSNEANTNVIVTFTDSAGVSHQMTVQTDGNGDWQAAANNILADGVYSVSATISDAAGNTSVDNKTGGEVDTVGPELTIVPSFLLGQLVSLSGTSDLGEGKTVTVNLELAGDLANLTYDVTTDANGDWVLLGLAVNIIGLSVVEASATDEAGNTTTITTADVDASTPLLNAVVDFVTGEGDLPIISGTTDQAPGTEVLVRVVDSDNIAQDLVAIVQADNSWAVQVPQSLAEGVFTVTVNVLSEVGITATQLISSVVDTISPTLNLQVIGTTSDSTPIIQGTSDLINGVVEIQLDGGSVLTTTVNAAGLFSLEVDALTEGQHVANVSITDDAGNVVTQTLEFVVDTLVPVVDILPLSISNTDILTISGTSEEAQGTDIDVTVIDSNGNATVFDALVGSDGTWSLVTTSLPDGIYSVFASITDAAGNVGQSVTEQVTIDTIPPSLEIDAFGVLNTLTPTITGTSDEEIGSLITVNVTDSTNTLYEVTTTVLGDGTWFVVTPLLAEGDLTIEAISIDDAGNIATVTQTGTVSTTLPSLLINPIIDTSDTTPTISGTTDVINGNVEVVITDSDGTATTYNTTAIAGMWTLIPTTPLAEGTFTVSATVEDLGLSSSTSLGGIIDLTPPTVEVDQLSVTNNPLPTITGISDAPAGTNVSVVITDANNDSQTITAQVSGNGTWSVTATTALSEGSFSATASISDTAGNSASDTMVSSTDYTAPTVVIDPILVGQDTTPTVTGSVTGSFAGELVIVTFTDSAGATHNVQTNVGGDGTWSIEAEEMLSEGNYTVDVSIVDSAGNIGTLSTSSAIDSGITIDSGLVLTTDQNPVITGTAAPGEFVTVTFSGATEATETVFADASGEWSVTANTTLADGAYTVTAVATDSSGNATSSGSLSGLVIDTTPINFTVEPEYLLNLLGIGILVGYEGTSDGGEGSKVYILDSLVLGIDLALTSAPYAVVDAQGNWDSTNLDLNALGLLGTGLENTYFYTVDEAGNYHVKNGNDVFIESGNIYDSGVSAASGDTIPESFSEESALGDTTPNEVSSNNVLSTETIDLGNLSGLSAPEQTVQVSSAEPLNINDVIIDEDAEQLIALNTLVEDEGSAIAYTPAQSGGSIDAAAPAVDVQNQSEEMIKHLIESSNNQTDI